MQAQIPQNDTGGVVRRSKGPEGVTRLAYCSVTPTLPEIEQMLAERLDAMPPPVRAELLRIFACRTSTEPTRSVTCGRARALDRSPNY